jgi:ubiquinone/menaquinone biosynthesis C-methylase UbiE
MNSSRAITRSFVVSLLAGVFAGIAQAQTAGQIGQFEPKVGQPGKDVVWVPTPQMIVDMMLDMARITPQDFVVDLGSGDGRNIITAAKRGARGRGVEYNPDMVALSQRTAAKEGVSDRATFVEGDMFAADFSDATVLALFLLPDNLNKLRDKFLALKPGTRIVANTFWIDGWSPDEEVELPDTECTDWCKVMLFVVPARVEGTWRFSQGELTLKQQFQAVTGTLTEAGRSTPISKGKMTGDQIDFTLAGAEYRGRLQGDRIDGTITLNGQVSAWTATRGAPQAQAPEEPGAFQPEVGQPGKDVVWVPTPAVTVEKMLDVARVTPQDYVVDLGSGDGRNVIAAAKRGATALGVEYNPAMVALSQRAAAKEGVSDKATFVEGDMFAADFSKATVLALFLLPDNMRTLGPKFLALKPGTRIVANTFGIDEWEPDVRETASGDCGSWCTVLFWIVPAKVGGTWRLSNGTLTIQQDYQKLYGTLRTGAGTLETIKNGRMNGEQMTFSAGTAEYSGRVNGRRLEGTFKSGNRTGSWAATRAN